MMTTTEILKEISLLPIDQRKDLREKILENLESNGQTQPLMTQNDFDKVLFDDGFLTNLPVADEDDDYFMPVEFTGKPISETIVEERR